MDPSGHQNRSKMVIKSLLEGSRGALEGFWRPMPKNEAGALWGPSWAVLGGSSAQDGAKIDEKMTFKIDLFFAAFGDQIFQRFWSILGAKMEPSWHQNLIKNRYQLRRAIFN